MIGRIADDYQTSAMGQLARALCGGGILSTALLAAALFLRINDRPILSADVASDAIDVCSTQFVIIAQLCGAPPPASNQGPACDRRLDVAQQPMANAGSKGLPVFRTPKHRTNNLRIAATTICLGLSLPRAFNRVTSATIAGLCRIADIAGM